MASRRKSREYALQALFSIDVQDEHDPACRSGENLDAICSMIGVPQASRDYFITLVEGIFDHFEDIDRCIAVTSSNWKLSRMPAVDRNIIRIAVYEMLYMDDIPAGVAINEAIEIGKKYGSEKSGSFINGILDSVYKHFKGASHEKETDLPEPG